MTSISKRLIYDRAQIEQLLIDNELPIRLYACKVAPRQDLVDDIMQKALVIAIRKIANMDDGVSFAAWVCGILRNVARDEWKALHRRSQRERDGLAEFIEQMAETTPDTSRFTDEHHQQLQHCLKNLPERSQSIITLHYNLGMTCAEVAEEIASTGNAVKMSLSRIRQKLHSCIQEHLA